MAGSVNGNGLAGVAAVRALVADRQPVRSVRRFKGDPEPGATLNGIRPGQWTPDALGLPPDCPVIPLGVDGSKNWFLDPIGQLVCYAKPYGQADTLELFRGRHLYLYWAWPKWRGKKADELEVDGWKNERAREALVAAATAKGPWNSVEKVRGRGTWVNAAGGLIVHCGERLAVSGGKDTPPGELDGHVYPTRPPIPGPWPQPIEQASNPAALLRPLLESWQWARPEADPQLLLGWLGAAYLGAALPWRPAVFITGDKATGKSTLQQLVKLLLGDALIQAADTSAAGVYQRVGQDCLPVAVDELEAESDTRKQKAVLKLARLAASGALMLRGGDRHEGVEFQARSCFLFSSINTPPLEPQDLSRMALLRLARLPAGQPPPILDAATLGILGRCILRRMLDQWPRFHETWSAFKGELAAADMDGRGQDTFGTLLTCADMIEHDGWDEARLRVPVDGDLVGWRELMAIDRMAEFEDAAENWRLCLDHLLSVPVDAWRNGTRPSVGYALDAWMRNMDFEQDFSKVKAVLGQAGLTLVRREHHREWLAIPNQNPLVRQLFVGSKWAGESGAGVWAGALRQSPRGSVHDVALVKINGVASRCTLISLDALYGRQGIMRGVDEDARGMAA